MSDTQAHADHMGTAETFYREVMREFDQAGVPFLVGGAYAFARMTGIHRDTKDLDLFMLRDDLPRAFAALEARGWRCHVEHAHWLAKVRGESGDFIDLVFSSGNGLAAVDEEWFAHGLPDTLLGRKIRLCPPEETLWSKAFIMERERFDGADVTHLLLARGRTLDWPRLLRRFGPHWRVLLAHLVLFGFAFPGERDCVPPAVMGLLLDRLRDEPLTQAPDGVCAGTLLSRQQYLHDVTLGGKRDARLAPLGTMSEDELREWTAAIGREGD